MAQLVECLPATGSPEFGLEHWIKHLVSPSTQEVDTKGSKVQDHPQLHSSRLGLLACITGEPESLSLKKGEGDGEGKNKKKNSKRKIDIWFCQLTPWGIRSWWFMIFNLGSGASQCSEHVEAWSTSPRLPCWQWEALLKT